METRRLNRIPALTALATVCALVVPGIAAADPPVNDNYAARAPIVIGGTDSASVTQAGVESEEQLTLNDATHRTCGSNGAPDDVGAKGTAMATTVWWTFKGNGRPVTVSTAGSDFNTVVAVYDDADRALQGCNDDVGPSPTSEVVVPTQPDHQYSVQVGGCVRAPQPCKLPNLGTVKLAVSGAPDNDNRATPTPAPTSGVLSSTNLGATTEPGELDACDGRPVAKTVWFTYKAPKTGTATFSASGIDSAVAVYRSDGTSLTCHANSTGPLDLSAGTYLISVGGAYANGLPVGAAPAGKFDLRTDFAEIDGGSGGTSTPPSTSTGPSKLPRIRTAIHFHFNQLHQGARRFVRANRMTIWKTPDNSQVTIRCSGKGCPFRKPRKITIKKAPKNGRYSILKHVDDRFYGKAQLTVDVTKTGRRGIRSRFMIQPRHKVRARAKFIG